MGRPFCENFSVLVKCSRDSTKKSDWCRCKKISQKLKYLNFKCEQSERYFFVLICSFHHSAHAPCEKIRCRLAKCVSGNQALRSNFGHFRDHLRRQDHLRCHTRPDLDKFCLAQTDVLPPLKFARRHHAGSVEELAVGGKTEFVNGWTVRGKLAVS